MAYFRCGGGGIPSSLKTDMNAVYNKKFGTSTTYDPSVWASTANLMGPLPERTVSGAIAQITDGADTVPIKSWEVTIDTNLSGKSSVVCAATGVNLFDKSAVTPNTWIIVNSTATEATTGFKTSDYIPVKANTKYYVTSKSSNRSAYYNKDKTGIAYFSFTGGASFTALYDGYIRITISDNVNLDTFIVNEGATAETYEPFGTTSTVNLGRTVHGGSVDVVNGTGTDENDDPFTFTPISVDTKLGVNNFWADAGDSSITYRADIDLLLGGN